MANAHVALQDRFGRKKTIQIGALIAAVGGILQCAAVNLAMLLVGRIISGWAIGLMSMSIPVYQAECADPKIRGLIVGYALSDSDFPYEKLTNIIHCIA